MLYQHLPWNRLSTPAGSAQALDSVGAGTVTGPPLDGGLHSLLKLHLFICLPTYLLERQNERERELPLTESVPKWLPQTSVSSSHISHVRSKGQFPRRICRKPAQKWSSQGSTWDAGITKQQLGPLYHNTNVKCWEATWQLTDGDPRVTCCCSTVPLLVTSALHLPDSTAV